MALLYTQIVYEHLCNLWIKKFVLSELEISLLISTASCRDKSTTHCKLRAVHGKPELDMMASIYKDAMNVSH